MKKLFFVLPALFLAMLLFVGCQDKPSIVEPTQIEKINIDNSNSGCTPIYAGQTIEVGTVCLEDDWTTHTLKVTYTVNAPWVITEIHFAVGANSSDIPVTKKGNMIPGQFPYVFTFADGKTTYSFDVPFDACGIDNCDDNEQYFGAAHCVVEKIVDGQIVQTETGWANGSTKPGNSWGEIFGFKVECYDTGDDENGETAFAYGCDYAKCFNKIDEKIARWGWSNGPLTEKGTYTWDLYAAAGQCDLSKGTIVGTLTVEYDGSTANVTYNTCGDYKLDEVHLYVGCDPLPKDKDGDYTVAPGQYPKVAENLNGETSYSSKFENLDCPNGIYVVAHAVVVGDYTKGSCEEEGCDFVPACTPAGLFYGTNVGSPEYIYSVDVSTNPPNISQLNTQTLNNYAGSDDGNYPNGLAWDESNNLFIYAEGDGSIWTYKPGDATSNKLTVAYSSGTPALGSYLPINGGAWYNGKYYFIEYNTNKLYEGVIVGNTITLKLLYNLSQTCGFFGDVAFDPEDAGIMYGWCEVGAAKVSTFFKVDIATGGLTVIKNTGYSGIRQLAFAYTSDGWKLYTASAGTGAIATVDKASGVETPYYTPSIKFTDLASGPKCK